MTKDDKKVTGLMNSEYTSRIKSREDNRRHAAEKERQREIEMWKQIMEITPDYIEQSEDLND